MPLTTHVAASKPHVQTTRVAKMNVCGTGATTKRRSALLILMMSLAAVGCGGGGGGGETVARNDPPDQRSEEHTSELQSRENLVCRLLLEKKRVDQRGAGEPAHE